MREGEWLQVGSLAEVPPGSVKRAEAGGRVLVLVNVDGIVYALDGICPHQGGPLYEGDIWQGQLECPWHHFRYDPRTGVNTFPANVYPLDLPGLQSQLGSLHRFPVRVEGGKILVRWEGDEEI
jgi:3-phenylpropionate/trans-cinnamate dioxygenase ferredoxin subunit